MARLAAHGLTLVDVTPAWLCCLGDMTITNNDIAGLSAKLEGLDLGDGERLLLDQIIAAAGDDEVGGFSSLDFGTRFMTTATRLIGDEIGLPRSTPSYGFPPPAGFAESGKKGE